MLQCHYRSTLDLTDEALLAAEKGYKRLFEAIKKLQTLSSPTIENGSVDKDILTLIEECYINMDDDFSTPKALATIFEMVTKINSLADGTIAISEVSNSCLDKLRIHLHSFISEVFGLLEEGSSENNVLDGLMKLVLELRNSARTNKDWATSDKIRDGLESIKIQVKDGKDGSTWSFI
jgi:cysteinyl-tRNA synthetase